MKSSQILKVIFSVVLFLFLNNCSTDNTFVQTPQQDTQGKVLKICTIERIFFKEEENYTRIQMEGSEPITPPFYKLLSDPLRIAIDVPNIELKEIKGLIAIQNGTIAEIVTTQYDDKGRIEIGLIQMTNFNISKEGKNLIVDIEKIKPTLEVKEIKKEEVAETKETKKEEETIKETKADAPAVEPKKEEPSPPPTVVNKAKEVVNVLFEEKSDFITFNIVADGRLENYNSFKLDSPARLVLDIWGVGSRYQKKSLKTKNPFVKEVRIGQHPDKLRLVFDSSNPQLPPYQINRIDNKLIVSIGNVPQSSEPQIILQEKATKDSIVSPKVQAKIDLTSQELKKPSKTNVTEIDFKQMDNKSRIVVALTDEPQYESRVISKNMIVVDIKNAFAPKHLQRGLDTSEFESAVKYISIKNIKKGKKANDVRILIQLREDIPFETTQEGKILFIDIMKPQKIEAKMEAVPILKKEEVIVETANEEIKKEGEKPVTEVKKVEKVSPIEEKTSMFQPLVTKQVEEEKKASVSGLPKKIYTKPKLSLDFKDGDIKNILRMIAEVSNLNIIVGDGVTGKITMRLVEVPWDQALDIILEHRGLVKIEKENVIRIVSPDTLKKEKQDKLDISRIEEKIEKLEEDIIWVDYAAAKDLIPQLKNILSDGKGKIEANERTNSLVIIDTPENILKVKNLVKKLDRKTPQVFIEARIIEANLTFQRELGVSWGFQLGGGKAAAQGGLTDNKLVDLPAVARSGVPGTTGTAGVIEFIFSRGTIKDLDIAISAHENKGDVRVISSPKIAMLDNKQASIEQGLRIPYLKLTTEGTVTTDFIDANLKLTVTPRVTNDGNIKLIIDVKKDAPDQTIVVQGVPSIDKKQAITEVLIKDNGVVVIAGIYTIEKSDGTEGIPLFSKIPLLGYLFKREAKEDKRKDLLIFISPKIIKDQI